MSSNGQFHLLFSDGGDEHAWWERWLDPAHKHLDIVAVEPTGAWLLESFGGHVTLTLLEPWTAERLIARWQGPVVVFNPEDRRRVPFPFGPTTCVTLAKAILGVNDWRVQTPLALKRWVLAHGGYEIDRESAEDHTSAAGA